MDDYQALLGLLQDGTDIQKEDCSKCEIVSRIKFPLICIFEGSGDDRIKVRILDRNGFGKIDHILVGDAEWLREEILSLSRGDLVYAIVVNGRDGLKDGSGNIIPGLALLSIEKTTIRDEIARIEKQRERMRKLYG